MPPLPFPENLANILLNCAKDLNLFQAIHLHEDLCKHGLDMHKSLAHHLVPMLVEHGIAKKVFDTLENCSWNLLIRAFVKCNQLQPACSLYEKMQENSLQPSVYAFVALIKACAALKDFSQGCTIHCELARKGFLEGDLFVVNSLIDMYGKWGWVAKGQEVFDNLPAPDVVSWTGLMAGYTSNKHGAEGLKCFEKMQLQGFTPNSLTYVCCLKACGSAGAKEKGVKIHAEVERKGYLGSDVIVGNAVVDMYVKLGMLATAREVFDKLEVRDIVSWTSMVAGYAQHDLGMEALSCFEQMQAEGVFPNAHTYVSCLKACGLMKFIDKGREIHEEIQEKGLLKNLVVGSAVVDMYSKCGFLATAEDVLSKLPVRDVISWNALITGYIRQDLGKEALDCFERMRSEGINPNAITYVCLLKACGTMKASDKGQELHAEIAKRGSLEGSLFVGSALVDMYAKCGVLAKTQEVFDELLNRDVITWNALIAGYASNECSEKALDCFNKMQSEKVSPDAATFICSLNACGSIKASNKGREIHGEIARKGLLEKEVLVGNALIDMYAKCGLLAKAEEVLDGLAVRDVVSWTTLIAGYTLHECGVDALGCFERMQLDGILPNAVTFACSLKACGLTGAVEKGRELHAEAAIEGLLESSHVLGSSVVDMYAKCGWLEKAQEVFDKLLVRDVIAWNSLIAGYAKYERGKDALDTLELMKVAGVSPNKVTFISSLKACGFIGDSEKGECIHAEIDSEGLLGKDPIVGNALIDMYAKCGSLVKAQEVFDKLLVRDVITWNALIAGYANNNHSKEALDCFQKMHAEGVTPDGLTFASCLKACSSIGATDQGGDIHMHIAREGLLVKDLSVGNALIDFYIKCGWLAKAQEVFDKLPLRDAVSWNALITGYAQSGNHTIVFNMYERMTKSEKPDFVTFLSVLNACSHAGLVDKAEVYFEAMTKTYGLRPMLEHYTCLVDLLGRAGYLGRAVAMIENMTSSPDLVVWHTVLDACQKWNNVELGKKVFENAVRLDAKVAVAYVHAQHL